jgi:hypothetical protein
LGALGAFGGLGAFAVVSGAEFTMAGLGVDFLVEVTLDFTVAFLAGAFLVGFFVILAVFVVALALLLLAATRLFPFFFAISCKYILIFIDKNKRDYYK